MDKKIFRRVGILVGVSLIALASLQGMWLYNMYRDMNASFSRQVTAALEKSAYEELISRKVRPSITTENKELSNILDSLRGRIRDSIEVTTPLAGQVRSVSAHASIETRDDEKTSIEVQQQADSTMVMINVTGDLENVESLAMTINIPSKSTPPDRESVMKCDTLIAANLRLAGTRLPYRLILRDNETGDAIYSLGDEIANPILFELPADSRETSSYVLSIVDPSTRFLKEMSGILLSSVLIILLIAFVFWYLLRTLFRQKSLEKMRLDLTHNITHELKTPIAVAAAAGEALTGFGAAEVPEKRGQYLKVIEEQLNNLSAMVENILSMSLYEQAGYRLDFAYCDLKQIVEDQARVLSFETGGKAQLTTDITEGLVVFCDQEHFSTVIKNLLDNAVKYSTGNAKIKVSGYKDDGKTIIKITDNGIGIPRHAHHRIFEKFYRVPTGDRHDVKGFGLGLHYVHDMVLQHGGTVSVDSTVGRGTTFTIILPGDGK